MKIIISIFLVTLLAGCTSTGSYEYTQMTPEDPLLVFGDRFEKHSTGPAKNFLINITEVNNCSDYGSTGVISNHWAAFEEHSRQYPVPKNKKILIEGIYVHINGYIETTCYPGPISFMPEPSKKYSIDIPIKYGSCRLSIVEILPDETYSDREMPQKTETRCIEE